MLEQHCRLGLPHFEAHVPPPLTSMHAHLDVFLQTQMRLLLGGFKA